MCILPHHGYSLYQCVLQPHRSRDLCQACPHDIVWLSRTVSVFSSYSSRRRQSPTLAALSCLPLAFALGLMAWSSHARSICTSMVSNRQ